MNLRIKPKKRMVRERPQPLAVPEAINQVWSMDFMHDQLERRRSFRLFNVLDDFNREGLGYRGGPVAALGAGDPGAGADHRVARQTAGDSLRQWPGVHQRMLCRNGPRQRGIRIDYIQPGKPQQLWLWDGADEQAWVNRLGRLLDTGAVTLCGGRDPGRGYRCRRDLPQKDCLPGISVIFLAHARSSSRCSRCQNHRQPIGEDYPFRYILFARNCGVLAFNRL